MGVLGSTGMDLAWHVARVSNRLPREDWHSSCMRHREGYCDALSMAYCK